MMSKSDQFAVRNGEYLQHCGQEIEGAITHLNHIG